MCFSSRIVAVNISAAMSSSEDQQKLPGHRMCNWTFGSVLMVVWPLGTQAPMQIRLRSTKRKRGHENAHSVMCVRCCRWTTCHMSMHLKACFVHCRLIALEPAFSLSFHIWLCLSFCIQFAIGNLVWAADSNIFAVRIFICSLPSVRSLCTVCIEMLIARLVALASVQPEIWIAHIMYMYVCLPWPTANFFMHRIYYRIRSERCLAVWSWTWILFTWVEAVCRFVWRCRTSPCVVCQQQMPIVVDCCHSPSFESKTTF